ncbi:hypothetical protein EYF80_056156 [Liparis tanakae]|uniref:Uncharacterized protein n=1 Tax=Liparis tanakae TaxID=230148 RepID=A0A4Z2EZ85_9TELE|nr:hypothetical protein EYF80_056156 [Liparis tanakae]
MALTGTRPWRPVDSMAPSHMPSCPVSLTISSSFFLNCSCSSLSSSSSPLTLIEGGQVLVTPLQQQTQIEGGQVLVIPLQQQAQQQAQVLLTLLQQRAQVEGGQVLVTPLQQQAQVLLTLLQQQAQVEGDQVLVTPLQQQAQVLLTLLQQQAQVEGGQPLLVHGDVDLQVAEQLGVQPEGLITQEVLQAASHVSGELPDFLHGLEREDEAVLLGVDGHQTSRQVLQRQTSRSQETKKTHRTFVFVKRRSEAMSLSVVVRLRPSFTRLRPSFARLRPSFARLHRWTVILLTCSWRGTTKVLHGSRVSSTA